MEDIVEELKKHYCYYRQDYIVMTKKYSKTTGHYFKDGVIKSHLKGYYAIGVFSGPNATKFISVDVDDGGKVAVHKVIDTFCELGIPRDMMYVSTSGKKGYHVDLFFDPYIYNNNAKNLYDLMIWRSELDPAKVEFRPSPKQAIKLPLGIHMQTGNRCWYVDRETLKPIESFDYIKEIRHMDSSIVKDILRKWNKEHWNEMYIDMICNDSGHQITTEYNYEMKEEYYEKHKLVKPGTRHSLMLQIARDLRLNGAYRSQIIRALRGWYYKQDKALIETPENAVLEDIDEIAEWAEENVPIVFKRELPKDPKPIVFDKYDINYILMAPTKAARKITLLLWTYCKIYGVSQISYEAIAKTTGCVVATAETAVAKMVKDRIIYKEGGGISRRKDKLVRRANKYTMPKKKILGCPRDEDLVAEEYVYKGLFNRDNFDEYYYKVLSGICKESYLSKFLTKGELEECRRVAESGAGDAGGEDGVCGVR